MLYIKSLMFWQYFGISSGKLRPEGQLSRGIFMLDKTQICLCIKKLYYHEKYIFLPFQIYENSNPLKLIYPC